MGLNGAGRGGGISSDAFNSAPPAFGKGNYKASFSQLSVSDPTLIH